MNEGNESPAANEALQGGASQPVQEQGAPQSQSASDGASAAAAGGEGQPQGEGGSAGEGVSPTGGAPSLLSEAAKEGEPQGAAGQPGGAPEKYEAFKVADLGEIPPEKMEAFVGTARDLGLSQESAQKMVDTMLPAAKEYLQKDLASKVAQWRTESENDPEFGGANLKANLSVASAAYKQFVSPGLNAVLESSGLNNHPEVLRLFYRIGKSIQQDPGVAGSASTPAGPRRRYPKSNMVVE